MLSRRPNRCGRHPRRRFGPGSVRPGRVLPPQSDGDAIQSAVQYSQEEGSSSSEHYSLVRTQLLAFHESRCNKIGQILTTCLNEEECELRHSSDQASPSEYWRQDCDALGADGSSAGAGTSSATHGQIYELISGLPNEITVDKIIARLPRKSVYNVSFLNRSWQRAFLSGQVYDAQMRIGNTQTLIVALNSFPKVGNVRFRAISLYDPVEDSWHLLPPIPGGEEGIPYGSRCVVFKGKLYVMGGFRRSAANLMCDTIFEFDLGSYHGGWRICGSMEFSREDFSCLVYDGGIYVFGGWNLHHDMSQQVSVYHPEQNCWTKLPDMPHKRCDARVLALDGCFWMYGGNFLSEEEEPNNKEGTSMRSRFKKTEMERWTDMYDSNRREWCRVPNFTYERPKGAYVSAGGTFCHITCDSVDVLDLSTMTWSVSRVNTWRVLDKLEVRPLWPTAALFVDGELFILLEVEDRSHYRDFRVIPMKSIGFTGDRSVQVGGPHATGFNKEARLVWQQIGCPPGFGSFGERNPSIQAIQLAAGA